MARSLRAISFEGGMILQLDITAIRPAEIPFAFDQDEQLDSRSGCIGHLQGDFGSGREFYPEWVDHQAQFKTHDFGVELNKVVHALRAKGGCGLLADRHRMAEFCARHPETALGTGYAAVYGVKLKTAVPTCCAVTRVKAKPTSASTPTRRRCWNTVSSSLPGSGLCRPAPASVRKRGKQDRTISLHACNACHRDGRRCGLFLFGRDVERPFVLLICSPASAASARG